MNFELGPVLPPLFAPLPVFVMAAQRALSKDGDEVAETVSYDCAPQPSEVGIVTCEKIAL